VTRHKSHRFDEYSPDSYRELYAHDWGNNPAKREADATIMMAMRFREAAVRRFRPIVLTAAAAVLAMIPLTRSVLWGPMAYAIMGGLIVATVLTLLFVPALYAAWFRVRRPEAATAGSIEKAFPQPA